jgi:hypothetical protein
VASTIWSPHLHRPAAHATQNRSTLPIVESLFLDADLVLILTAEERSALARVLRVVEDNWWLDEVERRLLERLELPAAELVRPAA